MSEEKISDLTGIAQALHSVRVLYQYGAWEHNQNHSTLKKYMIEEAYELCDAIRYGSDTQIQSELGDVLLQVLFHCVIAENEGKFTVNDVGKCLTQKLQERSGPTLAGQIMTVEEQQKHWQDKKNSSLQHNGTISVRQFPGLEYKGPTHQKVAGVIDFLVRHNFPMNFFPSTLRFHDFADYNELEVEERLQTFLDCLDKIIAESGKIPCSHVEWNALLHDRKIDV